MKVWYCFKKKRQLVKGEVDCDLTAAHKRMELHPVGTDPTSEEWEGEHCNDCGRAYKDAYSLPDGWYSLPDDVWALIHERAPAGLLCPTCALRRVIDKLHPAGSRVVTAEALVIEKVDGEWPEWAAAPIGAAIDAGWLRGAGSPFTPEQIAEAWHLLLDDLADALAQSKEGAQ